MKVAIILSIICTFSTIQSIVNAQDIDIDSICGPCVEGVERGQYMKCVNMAVKEMKTLGMDKQTFKRIRKQAKKKARKCPYGKSETTDGSEDDEEDTTTEDSGDDGAEKDCTTILKENQCNNKWGGICSWSGISCASSSDGLGVVVIPTFLGDSDSSGGSVSGGQGQGKGNGNGGGKFKPNKPYKPDKQGGGVNISGGSVSGGGQGGGKWGGNKPNKPWGGNNKPQGSVSVGKVKPNQGNQGEGSSSGESEDSEDTVITEETTGESEDTEDSEDTSEDDGDEVDCSSAPKQMPCSKKGGGVCAWINGSCQPKRRHLYLRK